MSINTGGARVRGERFLEEYPAPLGDVLSAQAREAWNFSPTSSLARNYELSQTQRVDDQHTASERSMLGLPARTEDDLSKRLSQEEASERVKADGLDLDIPEDGIREETLDVLMRRKRDEVRRRDILNRAPSNVSTGVMRLGTALGVSMLDPLNVGAAFVPVVGAARYARSLEQAGSAFARAGVRARYGAVEGTVGVAALEPLVYGTAQREQADYTVIDSAINVAFGTVLGGGLHTGAGAVADALRRGRPIQRAEPQGEIPTKVASYKQSDRKALLQTAIAQSLEGRDVNVSPLMGWIDGVEAARPSTLASARRQVVAETREDMQTALRQEAEARLPRGRRKELQGELKGIDFELGRVDGDFRERVKTLQREEGVRRREAEGRVAQTDNARRQELQRQRDEIEATLRKDDVARAAKGDLSRLEQDIVPERFRGRVDEQARAKLDAARSGLSAPMRSRPDVDLQGRWNALREAARRDNAPSRTYGHDPELVQRINDELKAQRSQPESVAQAREQADEYLAEIQEIQSRMSDNVLDEAEIRALDEEITRAQEYRRGLDAMADCQLRRA